MIKISGFASALPARKVTAEEIADWTGGEAAFIRNKVGIEDRRYLGENESAIDLAAESVTKLFASSGISAADIDLLVFVTQTPEYGIPQNSSLLCDKLGLSNTCASFDVSLGCSGWVYGLSVTTAFMEMEQLETAVLVTCDPYSRVMDRSDKSTVTVFGDAAAATLLTRSDRKFLGRGVYGTDGGMGDRLITQSGGAADPLISVDTDPDEAFDRGSKALQMNGRAILEFMMTRVPDSVDQCLAKNALTRDEIDYFVFHQASEYMLKTLVRQMGLPSEKVPISIRHTGNTVSSSIPLILENLSADGALEGKKVLVCGFGVGLSWASNILFF